MLVSGAAYTVFCTFFCDLLIVKIPLDFELFSQFKISGWFLVSLADLVTDVTFIRSGVPEVTNLRLSL